MLKEIDKYKDPYSYIGFIIWTLENITSSAMEDYYTGKRKIPYSYIMVLSSLYWLMTKRESINQKDLANYTHMKEITISVIIRKLNKLGLVEIIKDKEDMRAKKIKVSKKGAEVLTGFLDIVVEVEKNIQSKTPELMTNLKQLKDELSFKDR
ncbi:MAG: winged helix DNA-binding protein [bacterium]